MILLIGSSDCAEIRTIYDYLHKDLRLECLWLTPESLVNDLLIDDTIDSSGISVRWQYKGRLLTRENVGCVINNLSYFPKEIFDDFVREDQSYAASEFLSYFLFSLCQFTNVSNRPHGGSLSGWTKSLPHQWIHIDSKFPATNTPKWALSSKKGTPSWVSDTENIALIANRNMFDLRYWQVRPQGEPRVQEEDVLYYERPAGIPIIVNGIDERIFVGCDSPLSACELSNYLPTSFLREISRHYGLSLYHMLVFFDQASKKLTFGCLVPFLHFYRENNDPVNNLMIHAISGISEK